MSEPLKPRKKNSQNHAPGYVYASRNSDYPNDTKVGLTANPGERIRGHNRDTMSTPNWKYAILKRVSDMKYAEDKILDFFYGTRWYLSPSREILRGVPYEKLKTIFDLLDGEEIAESDFITAPPIKTESEPVPESVQQIVTDLEGYESPVEEKVCEGLLLQIKRKDKDGPDIEWYGTVTADQGIDCQSTNKIYDSILKWNTAHAVSASGNPKANPSTYDAIRYQDQDGEWHTLRKRCGK